jgi:hypothetical protein
VTTNLPTYLSKPTNLSYLLTSAKYTQECVTSCMRKPAPTVPHFPSLCSFSNVRKLPPVSPLSPTSRHFVTSATHASYPLFSPLSPTSRHFVPSATHASCRLFSPPFPSCACSAFRPVRASIRFLRINSPRGYLRNTVQSLSAYRCCLLRGISDSAFLNCISSFVPYSLPYLLKI